MYMYTKMYEIFVGYYIYRVLEKLYFDINFISFIVSFVPDYISVSLLFYIILQLILSLFYLYFRELIYSSLWFFVISNDILYISLITYSQVGWNIPVINEHNTFLSIITVAFCRCSLDTIYCMFLKIIIPWYILYLFRRSYFTNFLFSFSFLSYFKDYPSIYSSVCFIFI